VIRVGIVNFVNARPLARGLERDSTGLDLVYLPPARVADELAAGRLDVGLLPSIELARIPGLEVLPGCAIAATHEVRSVLLVSRVPVAEIRSLALDENSRTSAALVRLLLAARYGVEPELRAAAPRVDEMLATSDAALVIGDPALRVDRDRYVVLDLAGEWLELTGRPFVFAVWAVRSELATPELAHRFERSLEAGLAELEAIVEETAAASGIAPAVLRDYYTRNLSFRLGDAERRGLAEFLRRAELAGLSPRGAGAAAAAGGAD
jgi:chorismate dehydratase